MGNLSSFILCQRFFFAGKKRTAVIINILMLCYHYLHTPAPITVTHTQPRPMYIDSINWVEPDGDQPVAIQLRSTVEPLLKVMCLTLCILYMCTFL